MKNAWRAALALVAGIILAYSLATTLAAGANYFVRTQNCLAANTTACRWAQGGLVTQYLGALVALPVLALLLSALAYAVIGSAPQANTRNKLPSGARLGVMFLVWWGLAGLFWFLLYQVPTATSVRILQSNMQWTGIAFSLAALLCAVLLGLRSSTGWLLTLTYLVLSLCMALLSLRIPGAAQPMLLLHMLVKLVLLVYLLLPRIRQAFVLR